MVTPRYAAKVLGFLAITLQAGGPGGVAWNCQDPEGPVTEIRIVQAMARIEGWGVKDSLVRRLNNPGALAFAGQIHATRTTSGWARFPSEALGWQAAMNDFRAKRRLGMDLPEIIRMRSGPTDNQAHYLEILTQILKER